MATLSRSTQFPYLAGSDWVEVMTGTQAECEARGAELEAKGFQISIEYDDPDEDPDSDGHGWERAALRGLGA